MAEVPTSMLQFSLVVPAWRRDHMRVITFGDDSLVKVFVIVMVKVKVIVII